MAGDLNYTPLESEIYERAEALRWMVRVMGWEWELVDLIFLEDTPSLQLVRDMVYRHGPDEAKRRLRLFLDDMEIITQETPIRIIQEGPENDEGLSPAPYIMDISFAASQPSPARPEGT
jgi:hypothetical protein